MKKEASDSCSSGFAFLDECPFSVHIIIWILHIQLNLNDQHESLFPSPPPSINRWAREKGRGEDRERKGTKKNITCRVGEVHCYIRPLNACRCVYVRQWFSPLNLFYLLLCSHLGAFFPYPSPLLTEFVFVIKAARHSALWGQPSSGRTRLITKKGSKVSEKFNPEFWYVVNGGRWQSSSFFC